MDPKRFIQQLAGKNTFGVHPMEAALMLEQMRQRNQKDSQHLEGLADKHGYTSDQYRNYLMPGMIERSLEFDQAMGRIIGQEPSGYDEETLSSPAGISLEVLRRLAGEHTPVDFTGKGTKYPHIRPITNTSPTRYHK